MSWKDVIAIIGAKLFSVRADMIFALVFAVTFGLARRWTGLIPVFAAVSVAILVMCALMLRHRAGRSGLLADADNEADIKELFYRSDSGEWKSTGRTEVGSVNFTLKPKITGGKINLEVKYADTEGREHGPYSFTFDVA
ncbi:MAG: hypothetical protein IJP86_01710 [Synergistaceae bacterium]|nr:hypothetical protein [Synergistaceae bacterium]